jgi:N-acetylmuramoyl-L-alanine amidase
MISKPVWILVFLLIVSIAPVIMGDPIICIDPGHGGSDPGAIGFVTETVINLDASLKLRDWLNLDTSDARGGYAWVPIMTRSTDIYITLDARTTYANENNADRFLSIHSNWYQKESANGSETYCSPNASSEGFALRNTTQEELVAHGGLYNRGNKLANFYVITYTNMPSALTEMGFTSNEYDASCLANDSWRNEVTKGFLHGFQRLFGYDPYTPSYSEIIVDNTDSGYAEVGTWADSTNPGYYGTNSRYSDTGVGDDTATWSPTLDQEGSYDVYAWWVEGTNRAANAVYRVNHSGGYTNIQVDQTANGGQWNLLGNYNFSSGTSGNVVLTDNAEIAKVVSADAIKFSLIATPTPTPTPTPEPGQEVIIDNDDGAPGYTETGSWSTSTSSGYLDGTYRYAAVQKANTATWTGYLSEAGNYEVFVIYRASTNRSTAARYVIHTASGDVEQFVNQQNNNLVWVSLGTYAFNAGDNSLTLDALGSSGNKKTVVIADAVKFLYVE